MRYILFAAFLAAATVAQGDDDIPPEIARQIDEVRDLERQRLFDDYVARRKQRRVNALAIRREMNAGKVHRYWTALVVPVNPLGVSAIQRGWVNQPPIRGYRTRYVDTYVPSHSK